ncbi:MAG: DoxX family protein [Bacteroidales bacterium]
MAYRMFSSSNQGMQIAIFLIRVSFGIIYILHGFPKIAGGPEQWAQVGGAMGTVGLGFAPAFWGFMASISELGGGLLLVLGLFTRPAAAFMAITMLIALIMHISVGDSIGTVLHPLKGLVVFVSLLYSGGGKYSVDNMLGR